MPQLRVGDLNNDGTIGTKQLTMTLSSLNNVTGYRLTETQEIEADYNADGIVDISDLTFATNYLANNNTADEYLDPNEISGEFKIKSTSVSAFDSFDINSIILNTGGSFTNLAQSIEKNEADGFSILTVDFTYNTKQDRTGNDGVFLANTDYEVLSWSGIPLSRNWSVFNTTFSGTGLFEGFTGKIATVGNNQPTILRYTSFKNMFKDTNLQDEDYGNFDLWDTKGVTQVTVQGNLMANGFQVAGKMKLINTNTEETIITFDSGYKGNYELDMNPNELPDKFTIEMDDSVDVARAVRNEGVIQKIERSKSDVYKGISKNVVPLGSITTIYKQNPNPSLFKRKIQYSMLKKDRLTGGGGIDYEQFNEPVEPFEPPGEEPAGEEPAGEEPEPLDTATIALIALYDLVDENDLTKDFITTPNNTLCVLNQQIMNIIQTTKLLLGINDTSFISLAISNAIVNDYTNKLGTGNAYFNFSHVDIITSIVEEVITNYGDTISVSTVLRQNTIDFLTMSNRVLDDKRTGDSTEASVLAILSLASYFNDHVNENTSDFNSTFSTEYLTDLETTATNNFSNVTIHSLNLPEKKTTPFTDSEISLLKSAVSLAGGNYAEKQVSIALYGISNEYDVSQVTNMDGLFFGSTFNEPINDWDTRNVTSMNQMFYDSSFNQDISKWDISNVTDMEEMFYLNFCF